MRYMRSLFASFLWRYRHRTPWQFCWRVAVEGLIVSALVGVPLLIFGASKRDVPESLGPYFIGAVFVVPWLETLVYQSAPIGLCRMLGLGTITQAIASIAAFTAVHLSLGLAPGISAGFVGGFYLAFTYIRWRRRTWWTAFWVTSLSHAIGNGILALLALISMALEK